MSSARGFGLNGKSFYTNVAKPMQVNLNWTVTPTNGLGITSLKSNGYVNNVFMHTSTTPTANKGFTNPNPLAGYALIQLKQNFNKFLGMQYTFQTPTATDKKIDNAELTVGQVYVITVVGDGTSAQWTAVGVPAGITPAVGVAFTALATGSGSGNSSTSRVQLPTSSTIEIAEIVGATNVMTTSNIATNAGQWVTIQFSKASVASSTPTLTMNPYTPAGTNNSATPPIFSGTPATLTGTISAPTETVSAAVGAPATGSLVMVQLYFDGSTVTVDGL